MKGKFWESLGESMSGSYNPVEVHAGAQILGSGGGGGGGGKRGGEGRVMVTGEGKGGMVTGGEGMVTGGEGMGTGGEGREEGWEQEGR